MIQPYKWFSAYLKSGYFPFFMEEADLYHQRLEEIVNMIIEIELPLLRNVSTAYLAKVKQLLSIIAGSAPFIPNILKISQRVGVNRETILSYLHYLSETHLTFSVYKEAKGISLLQKPDKIYLENTNLFYALNPENINTGNLRETFFANQLRNGNLVELSSVSDFLIDGKYTFEIGGKNKKQKQIETLNNAYIAKDDIEIGFGNVIPLWLFGFLY
jgi:predicted AAA+ superfamily ATPase